MHIVLDHENGHPHHLFDVLDPECHVLRFLHRKAGCRFIKQQQSWLHGQCASHLHDFSNAIGQACNQFLAIGLKVEEIDHMLYGFPVNALLGAHEWREQHICQEIRTAMRMASD